ncbi:MAG: hypothetical protein NTY19_09075 [Planctomycetota bacterium]|nr:hypothetical protein [Planctomycetota bacterium]
MTETTLFPHGDLELSSVTPPLGIAAAIAEIRGVVLEIRDRVAGVHKSHLTVEELADTVGRSPYTVRKWIKLGLVRAERISGTGPRGRLLIPYEELATLVGQGRGASIPGHVGQKSGGGREE